MGTGSAPPTRIPYRLDAAIASVKVIADYAVSMNDRLFELDVNPLIVMPDGAVALDAFIRRSES